MRHEIDLSLVGLAPTADRVLRGVEAGLWLRRQLGSESRTQRVAAALAAAGSVIGASGVGWFALRRWRWLRNAFGVWRLWRQLRA
jgi:hypothetical protein